MAVSGEECSNAQAGSSSSSSAASESKYYVAKSVLRGTAIMQMVSGHFITPSSPDIVFGKETSIEMVMITEEGILHTVSDQPLFGTIKDLAVVPWNDKSFARRPQGKDILVVISDSGKLSFLAFFNEMQRFLPLAHILLSSLGNSRCQLGRLLSVDYSGSFIAVSAYEDTLAVFSLSLIESNNIADKKVVFPPENEKFASAAKSLCKPSVSGTIWSMCFISLDTRQSPKEQTPLLAVLLNRREAVCNELVLLEWNFSEQAAVVISQHVENGPLAHDIVEVPHSNGFAFLFRMGDVVLMDLRDAHNPCCVCRTSLNLLPGSVEEQKNSDELWKIQDIDDDSLFQFAAHALLELRGCDPMLIDKKGGGGGGGKTPIPRHVCAWSWNPRGGGNPQLILCIDTGEFFMVEISLDQADVKVIFSTCMYKGLPCKALLWVDGGFVASVTDMSDGMVLKLDKGLLLGVCPIQNVAPILDMAVVDHHNEKGGQILACCGMADEGSLRTIQPGINVDHLLVTAPIYHGITGIWAVRTRLDDFHHSLLVLSFIEETRILSVGVSFADVTDSAGFRSDVSTLACGLVLDGLLVQIHRAEVRLCSPTNSAHAEGAQAARPICTTWAPGDASISLGAVGSNLIAVSTSSPCLLYVLGVRLLEQCWYQVFEMHRLRLVDELSCISIPPPALAGPAQSVSADDAHVAAHPAGVGTHSVLVVGTHKPSVEVLSIVPGGEGLKVLASGAISSANAHEPYVGGCIPQDVRLALADQFCVLAGLRNGMLLRFELPRSPSPPPDLPSYVESLISCAVAGGSVHLVDADAEGQACDLQLVAARQIGITPVSLVPLNGSLDADMVVLSGRPWLLRAARSGGLGFSSIAFRPSTHAAFICSPEYQTGVLFLAENSLHLVEMVHYNRLNVQKLHIGGTLRKVLYHNKSRLLVVMRNDLCCGEFLSDICFVDPLSGAVVSSFKFDPGETGKSMELLSVGSQEVLVVGTSLSSGPAVMFSGEAERSRGRLLVLSLEHVRTPFSSSTMFSSRARSSSVQSSWLFYGSCSLGTSPDLDDGSCCSPNPEGSDAWHLRLAYEKTCHGMVLAVCPYLDRYFLASSGNAFFVYVFSNDGPQKPRKLAAARTRFMIVSLTAHFTRIAVGDCRDGVLFYSYDEDTRRLKQLYSDPSQRLVADCALMGVDKAVVSDRKGIITILSYSGHWEDDPCPECNLTPSCSYYMGEIAMSIEMGSNLYQISANDVLLNCGGVASSSTNADCTFMAGTMLGGLWIFTPLSRKEYELLNDVQAGLMRYPLTAPILGNNHSEFRSSHLPAEVTKMLDGDMLLQFLELTTAQQAAVLSLSRPTVNKAAETSKPPSPSVNQVVQLLERLHFMVN